MTRPLSFVIGNITRFRNFEYIEETAVGRWPSVVGSFSIAWWMPDPTRFSLGDDVDFADGPRPATADEFSFHDSNPHSLRTSSLNWFFNRSRSRNPESGAKPIRNFWMFSSSKPRPVKYSRARAPSEPRRHSWKNAQARSWISSRAIRSF